VVWKGEEIKKKKERNWAETVHVHL
jgi:hypothetical protein